jgi:hypothetical protein
LDTVRAQNWTVPVALTPKFADPGDVDDDAAGEEPEDEQPAAAAVASAAADNSASVLRFMCRFLQDMVGAKAQRVPERPATPRGDGERAMTKAACGGTTAPAATLARY